MISANTNSIDEASVATKLQSYATRTVAIQGVIIVGERYCRSLGNGDRSRSAEGFQIARTNKASVNMERCGRDAHICNTVDLELTTCAESPVSSSSSSSIPTYQVRDTAADMSHILSAPWHKGRIRGDGMSRASDEIE
jgi:hypothetical protein